MTSPRVPVQVRAGDVLGAGADPAQDVVRQQDQVRAAAHACLCA